MGGWEGRPRKGSTAAAVFDFNHQGLTMENILVYGDSLTWGIIPDTRRRLPFEQRWPGILEAQLSAAGLRCRGMADAYRKVASDEGC